MGSMDDDVRQLLKEISRASDQTYCLPTNWLPEHGVPAVSIPLPENSAVDQDFLDWLDVHLGTETRVGKWYYNEASLRKITRDITITVTRDYLIQLWRRGGGSWCRFFGVRGSWVPGSRFMLTMDKINPNFGYVPGNIAIMLHVANMGKNVYYDWPVLLQIRDKLIQSFRTQ